MQSRPDEYHAPPACLLGLTKMATLSYIVGIFLLSALVFALFTATPLRP